MANYGKADEALKSEVHDFWNAESCGTDASDKTKFTKEYFDEIESFRYDVVCPEIFSFGQFTRWRGKKILEIGLGAGTDFMQWNRAGAICHGIDLTSESIEHVKHRLALEGLEAADFKQADAENNPYPDNTFDLVWSYGVIHHSPDTPTAFREIVRVLKPGGTAKVMIYNSKSVLAYLFWIKHALFKLRPWKSVKWVVWHHMESLGTKAYSVRECKDMLKDMDITDLTVEPVLTYYDRMERFGAPYTSLAGFLAWLMGGDRAGWFHHIEFKKRA